MVSVLGKLVAFLSKTKSHAILASQREVIQQKNLVICDSNLFPVDFSTAPGNRNDAPMGYEAIERIKDFERKGVLMSDKGFDSQRSRKEGQTAGFQTYIPHRTASSGKPPSQENKELETLIDLVQDLDKTDDILEDKAKRAQILSLIDRITHKKKKRSFTRKNIGQVTTHSHHNDPYDPELNEVNAAVYAHRNVAERSIGRIKDMKAISFRRVRCSHICNFLIAMAMMFIFYLPQ